MKKLLQYRFTILMLALAFFSCKKETSLENPKQTAGYATYTLLDTSGNCTTASIQGTYNVDSVLADSNYVTINVRFISTGKYYINTDTVNGMWFIDSGYVLIAGPATIKLKGYGKPILPNGGTFLMTHNNETCGFSLTPGAIVDYLPRSNGSTWRFQYIPAMIGNSGNNIDSFDVTVIPPSINYNSKVYAQYATSLLDTFYFAKQVNDYYEFGTLDFDYTFIFDQVNSFMEYVYLKDNQPTGTSWETNEMGVSYGAAFGGTSKAGTAKNVFTIISANQPYAVSGKTFQNVITVRRDIMFKETGATSFVKIMDGTAMYAKGFGLIDQAINLPGGTSKENIPILRWNIK
jgi:hypothetical protein